MNKLINALLQFLALAVILYAAHWYILDQFFSETPMYLSLLVIYLFNAIMVTVVLSVVILKVGKGYKKGYKLFLTLTLIKMALAIVLLLPLFFGKADNPKVDVINFFIPYFFFLAYEIWTLNVFFQKLESK